MQLRQRLQATVWRFSRGTTVEEWVVTVHEEADASRHNLLCVWRVPRESCTQVHTVHWMRLTTYNNSSVVIDRVPQSHVLCKVLYLLLCAEFYVTATARGFFSPSLLGTGSIRVHRERKTLYCTVVIHGLQKYTLEYDMKGGIFPRKCNTICSPKMLSMTRGHDDRVATVVDDVADGGKANGHHVRGSRCITVINVL